MNAIWLKCNRRAAAERQYMDLPSDEVTTAMNLAQLAVELGLGIDEVERRVQWLYRNEPAE